MIIQDDPVFVGQLELACATLAVADPILAQLIDMHGPCTIRPHTNYYSELVSAIIGQQLSVKAAATIEKRFVELFGGAMPTPGQILEHDVEAYRAVGMSRPKALYVLDLAGHIQSGQLDLGKIPELPNNEIIRELTAVKGIGEWTAHMFLIFALGRLDVLPVGDLGLRNALRLNYKLDALPSSADCRAVAEAHGWAPYESVATWYMWKSLDTMPVVPA